MTSFFTAPLSSKPAALIGARTIIQGASGSGKSYAVRKIAETAHGRMQQIILDVEDEFYTLRERFDYLLIGGEGADAPLREQAAEALAMVLLETGASAIIQLNDLGRDSGDDVLSAQGRFVGAFIAALMKAPKALWHPLLLIIDEAQRLAPQKGDRESLRPLINYATQGRKRGFGAIFATQRLSSLSKDILGQCQNRVIGRADQGLDRRAACDLLGFQPASEEGKGIMELSQQFWAVGPAFFPKPTLVEFAACDTTHLSQGIRSVPVPPPPERLRALIGQIAAIEDAGASNDPAGAANLTAARQAGYDTGFRDGRKVGLVEGQAKGFAEGLKAAQEALFALSVPQEAIGKRALTHSEVLFVEPSVDAHPAKEHEVHPTIASGTEISGPEKTLLQSIAWWSALGQDEPTRAMAAAIAGWRVTSGHLKNVSGSLRSKGLIFYPGDGRISLTEEGQQQVAAHSRTPGFIGTTIVQALRGVLSGPQMAVIEVLEKVQRLTRLELCERLGWEPSSGHVKNVLGSLRTLELVTYPAPGEVEIEPWVLSKPKPALVFSAA